MKHQPDATYIKQYKRGFAFGMNPAFHDCEDPSRIVPPMHDAAFLLGFDNGRSSYIDYNGPICDGIPDHVVTDKVITKFRIDGQLGYELDMSIYNSHQQQIIAMAYHDGFADYDEVRDQQLYDVLRACWS